MARRRASTPGSSTHGTERAHLKVPPRGRFVLTSSPRCSAARAAAAILCLPWSWRSTRRKCGCRKPQAGNLPAEYPNLPTNLDRSYTDRPGRLSESMADSGVGQLVRYVVLRHWWELPPEAEVPRRSLPVSRYPLELAECRPVRLSTPGRALCLISSEALMTPEPALCSQYGAATLDEHQECREAGTLTRRNGMVVIQGHVQCRW